MSVAPARGLRDEVRVGAVVRRRSSRPPWLKRLDPGGKVLTTDAGWSSSVARRAHNPEVAGSNPVPATTTSPVPTGTGLFCSPRVSSFERLDLAADSRDSIDCSPSGTALSGARGIQMSTIDPSQLSAADMSNPALTAQDLADITAARPDLRPYVATHPSLYPALGQWLSDQGVVPAQPPTAEQAVSDQAEAVDEAVAAQIAAVDEAVAEQGAAVNEPVQQEQAGTATDATPALGENPTTDAPAVSDEELERTITEGAREKSAAELAADGQTPAAQPAVWPGSPGSAAVRAGFPGSAAVRAGFPGAAAVRAGSPGSAAVRAGSPGSAAVWPGPPGSAAVWPGSPGAAAVRAGSPGAAAVRPGPAGAARSVPPVSSLELPLSSSAPPQIRPSTSSRTPLFPRPVRSVVVPFARPTR